MEHQQNCTETVIYKHNTKQLESSHSRQTSAKAMLFRHSLSDEIKQAKVLSAIQTIVALSTLT